MNDNVQPYRQSKNVNPNTIEFVDVVQWRLARETMKARFQIYHSVTGIEADFPVADYKFVIEASGRNAACDPKAFYVGMRNKDGEKNKIWMSETPF
jgi:hypothetical protein